MYNEEHHNSNLQELFNLSTDNNDFIPTKEEFSSLLYLLQIAEQILFSSLPPGVTSKYTFIKNLVVKNIEKERCNSMLYFIYLFYLFILFICLFIHEGPEVIQSPPHLQQSTIQQDIQLSKLMDIHSLISNLKSSIDDFHTCIFF